MKDFLYEGSEALKSIHVDLDYPGVDINIDFLHIDVQKPSAFYSLHAHPNFELHFIEEGEGEVGFLDTSDIDDNNIVELPAIVKSTRTPLVNQYHLRKSFEQKISKHIKVFQLKKGDAFMNPPGQFCWQKSSDNKPIIEYGMRFSFSITKTETPVNKHFIKEYKLIHQLLTKNIIQVTHNNNEIKSIFESIFYEAYHKLPGFIATIQNKLLNLIIVYARQSWDNSKIDYYIPEVNTIGKRLRMIDDFIYSNIANSIQIKQLAKYAFMSERNLCRFIKEHKGVSVHQYILHIRINKAIALYAFPEYTLTDVAYITGFSSPYHLSKAIKQYTGKNPSKLRE
jgi:AraC-like DNA-binding protein